jgi:phage baseplate assembly protein gpV
LSEHDFDQAVLRIVERWWGVFRQKAYGTVTSWDGKKHLAKVTLQPEGQESGWLPVQTMSAGNGYGHMSGLTAGDQVEVTFQEGEFEAGAITSRVHSEMAPAPTVESGEELIRTTWGSLVKLAKDGSVTVTDKSGATIKFDGSGALTISGATSVSLTGSGAVSMTSGAPMALSGGGNLT